MEKDNRRNSILKPVGNQPVVFEYEEEQTETYTFSRRKSMKRVSFAGRDEVKEFQKHEVLTVEKLEQALNKMQNESELVSGESNKLEIDVEKENLESRLTGNEFNQSVRFGDNMELATIAGSGNDVDVLLQQTVVQEIEMDLSCVSMSQTFKAECRDESSIAHEPDAPHISSTVNLNQMPIATAMELETSIQEVEMFYEETPPSTSKHIHSNHINSHLEVSPKLKFKTTQENSITISQTNTHVNEVTYHDSIKDFYLHDDKTITTVTTATIVPGHSDMLPKHPDFLEQSNALHQLLKTLKWQVKRQDSEVIFSKIYNYLILKIHLNHEYTHQNTKHYVIEEIEIDTKKGMSDKWCRFGLSMLETTLENCSLKSLCKTTQDIPILLHTVQEHCQFFMEFMIDDSKDFELLVNPRSLKIGIDNLELIFDGSNLENLLWVRIKIILNPTFPLNAKNIVIENLIGNANKTELVNMISTIRPSGHYLTRVAECVEDFLKFRPTAECKNLDVTHMVHATN